MVPIPPFEEALASFRSFVNEQGFSPDLVWVFREDVIYSNQHTLVRWPLPADNVPLAWDYFEFGRAQGLGVTLMAWCHSEGRSICSVWVPRDDREAIEALQAPTLKCSALVDPVEAWAIRSPLYWCWLTWWQAQHDQSFHWRLPARIDIRNQIREAI